MIDDSVVVLVVLAFVPMVLEAMRSARNERALRALGATEPVGDVYRAMQFAYPACFAAMIAEAWLGQPLRVALAASGFAVFAASKALKYWAIATLGGRWTFRVLVPPNSARTLSGPYRWLTHPNYVAVAGELLGFAMMARAPVTGALALVAFGRLMAARIRVEERALGIRRG